MSLNVCAHCTTRFAIGLPHCPQCGNADYYEEGSMAKITRHGGPTTVQDITASVAEPEAGLAVEIELPVPASPYEGLLRSDLQQLLRDRGLPTVGNKDDLIARLVASDTAAEHEEAPDVVGAVPVDSEGSGADPVGGEVETSGGVPE